AVPVERGPLAELDALLVPLGVDQAELDALGVLGEQREVRPFPVPLGTERERLSCPDLTARHPRDGTARVGLRRGGASQNWCLTPSGVRHLSSRGEPELVSDTSGVRHQWCQTPLGSFYVGTSQTTASGGTFTSAE